VESVTFYVESGASKPRLTFSPQTPYTLSPFVLSESVWRDGLIRHLVLLFCSAARTSEKLSQSLYALYWNRQDWFQEDGQLLGPSPVANAVTAYAAIANASAPFELWKSILKSRISSALRARQLYQMQSKPVDPIFNNRQHILNIQLFRQYTYLWLFLQPFSYFNTITPQK